MIPQQVEKTHSINNALSDFYEAHSDTSPWRRFHQDYGGDLGISPNVSAIEIEKIVSTYREILRIKHSDFNSEMGNFLATLPLDWLSMNMLVEEEIFRAVESIETWSENLMSIIKSDEMISSSVPEDIPYFNYVEISDLYAALDDLEEVIDEAEEEGDAIPSDIALSNARILLYSIYKIFPKRLEVYPIQDGAVVVHVPGGLGKSVLLICESSGEVLCTVNINGEHRRARYSNADLLPDGFVREALKALM